MPVIDVRDLNLKDKRVLIREDLNVPVSKDGVITSDARLRSALPTIEMALEAGARVMLMSHLGRPEEGVPIAEQPQFSLAPVVDWFRVKLGLPLRLLDDYLDGFDWGEDNFVGFENVRVNVGESKDDESLAKRLAAQCDVFVMDAFATAHRAQASTHGVARFAPVACAGPLLASELDALQRALARPAAPVVAVVGGSKVSTKLEVLEALADKVDTLVVGGGIANTFLAASGYEVGASLYEADLVATARRLLDKVVIPIPTDVVVGRHPEDIGPDSVEAMAQVLSQAATVIWNGPVGVFENDAFAEGTRRLTQEIAKSSAFSLAGGGDTLAAIDKYDVADQISYISTGGGAFLEFIEGKVLPAVAVLEERASS
jgi:phosphoglycerate kinase